jgi:hypothetical protein
LQLIQEPSQVLGLIKYRHDDRNLAAVSHESGKLNIVGLYRVPLGG